MYILKRIFFFLIFTAPSVREVNGFNFENCPPEREKLFITSFVKNFPEVPAIPHCDKDYIIPYHLKEEGYLFLYKFFISNEKINKLKAKLNPLKT